MIGKPKKVAICQSNYIPWKGYFDLVAEVDEFILYDDAQFTKNDWRNRNKIKTPAGVQWLTIPVRHKFGDRIRDVTVAQRNWHVKHWKTVQNNYAKAARFAECESIFRPLYSGMRTEYLSEINYAFIVAVNQYLGINTKISRSWDHDFSGDKTEKVLSLCKVTEADIYLSGPSARSYLDEELFREEGIEVEWMDYSGYREYPQLHPPFEHSVSIVDLIMNVGEDARLYLKSCKPV